MDSRPSSARPLLFLATLALVLLVAWLARRARGPAGPLVGEELLVKLLERPLEVRRGEVRRERLHITLPDLQAATGGGNPLVERELGPRLLAEDRDLWFAAGGSSFAVELPSGFEGVLLVGSGVHRLPRAQPAAPPAGVECDFKLSLEHAGMDAPTRLAHFLHPLELDDPRLWRPLAIRLSTRGLEGARLVLEASFVPARESPLPPETPSAEFLATTGFVWTNPVLVPKRASDAPARPAPPSVLVLSIDTLRADHLGAWGYERDTSPNLDRLAAEGARFAQARSSAPWTLPAYGSLFTGRLPTEHRAGLKSGRDSLWGTAACGAPLAPEADLLANQAERLAPELVTLAEALRDQGYRTAAFVNNPYLHSVRGVDQGFERYVWYGQRAEHGVDLALDWLERQLGLPTFLFLHLMDPHMPYAPPAPWDVRFQGTKLAELAARGLPWVLQDVRNLGAAALEWRSTLIDLYDAEIAYTDFQVGRLLAALDERELLDSTIVVLHADHGEEFWEHGGFEHGHALGRELLHVPLAIRYPPRIPAETVVEARVRAHDVLPTLLELLGLPLETCGLERGFEGEARALRATSLLSWIDGARGDDLPSLAEGLLWSPPFARWQEAKSLSDGPWKVIVGGADPATDLFYDVGLDPLERRELRAAREDEAARLRAGLEEAVRQARAAARSSGLTEVSEALLRQLEALGYSESGAEGEAREEEER